MKRDCQCPRVRHQHGTRGAYQSDNCRCFPCRLANSQAKAAWSAGEQHLESRTATVGVHRRLQALNAIGWTWKELGERLGVSRQAAYSLAGGRQDRGSVYAYTAHRVAALYDHLWNVRPQGVAASRARLAAARKGFLPPLAWDDDTIDDPAAQPTGRRPAPRTVIRPTGHLNRLDNDQLAGLLGLDADLGWRAEALCSQTDPEEFFPGKGGAVAAAKRICGACQVRIECLTFALEHDEAHGVWGGLSERERHRLKRGAA